MFGSVQNAPLTTVIAFHIFARTYSSHCIHVSLIAGMEHVLLTNRPETGTNVPDMHYQELEHKPSTVDLAANVSRSPSSEIYKQQHGMS